VWCRRHVLLSWWETKKGCCQRGKDPRCHYPVSDEAQRPRLPVRDPWRDLSFVRGRITPAILQNWTTSHRMHLRRSPGRRCVKKKFPWESSSDQQQLAANAKGNKMDAASSASRVALRHNAFDGDRLGLGTTIDRLSAGAVHRAFKGQLDASGKKWLCSNRCALFFYLLLSRPIRLLFLATSCPCSRHAI
jgi:hypothetical protein